MPMKDSLNELRKKKTKLIHLDQPCNANFDKKKTCNALIHMPDKTRNGFGTPNAGQEWDSTNAL